MYAPKLVIRVNSVTFPSFLVPFFRYDVILRPRWDRLRHLRTGCEATVKNRPGAGDFHHLGVPYHPGGDSDQLW